MDVTVESMQPAAVLSPFVWPAGSKPCTARVTVHQGRVSDLDAGCPGLDAPLADLRALSFVSDDLYRVFVAVLEPSTAGDTGQVRFENPVISPASWEASFRVLPVPIGTRCHATVAFTREAAEAIVDPGCPERLATEIGRAVPLVAWRISNMAPVGGVTFHAGVDFQWVVDVTRKNRGTLVAELEDARIREDRKQSVTDLLQEDLHDVWFSARLTVDAEGRVEKAVVEGCPAACQKIATRALQNELAYWPSIVDGVPRAFETTLNLTFRTPGHPPPERR